MENIIQMYRVSFKWIINSLIGFCLMSRKSSSDCNQNVMTSFFIQEAVNGVHLSTSRDSPDPADWNSSEWRQHKRHVFILSCAGKPIYSRYFDILT